ncbi:MAG: hypothetical protein ACQEXB_18555 [Bacillota bacterium]
MLQGICVDPGQTAVLTKGTSYYLFPNGANHYYVSKYPNPEAHKGCYSKEYFQLIEKEIWPDEPEKRDIQLEPDKVYKARLIWRKPGYKGTVLKEYFLKPKKTHAYFYLDEDLQKLCGCFPFHWFVGFEEVEPDKVVGDINLDFTEADLFLEETVHKEVVFEQLSLFDIDQNNEV